MTSSCMVYMKINLLCVFDYCCDVKNIKKEPSYSLTNDKLKLNVINLKFYYLLVLIIVLTLISLHIN